MQPQFLQMTVGWGLIMFVRVNVVIFSIFLGCVPVHCIQFPRKTRLQNDLRGVKRDVKLYSLQQLVKG